MSRRTDPPDSASAWREHNIAQLQYFSSLSLRAKLQAIEGMADVIRRLEQMRQDGQLKPRQR